MRANRRVSHRERLFRQALWRAGARGYRVQARLPGRPDIVFPKLRLAIFVNGCFWHGCSTCGLPEPKANADFWRVKRQQTRERDVRAERELATNGWECLTIWEHEIRPDPRRRASELALLVQERRQFS
jgi:DNA mismatch endonuclease (patch repair protein)